MSLTYTSKDVTLKWIKRSRSDEENKEFNLISSAYLEYVKELSAMQSGVSQEPLLCPEDNKDVNYVAIYQGEDFAGFFFYGVYPNAVTRHDIYLGEFYIKPEYRGQGIATKVFEMVIDSSKKQCMDISYFTMVNNVKAERLWTNLLMANGYEERFLAAGINSCTETEPICSLHYWILK
ncbi:MAG: GNAT family N-acetyltransferase [Butyrivibrio sp.]|nr:GNAT family N-acetyltransferase [Butyrivibrio sp.]